MVRRNGVGSARDAVPKLVRDRLEWNGERRAHNTSGARLAACPRPLPEITDVFEPRTTSSLTSTARMQGAGVMRIVRLASVAHASRSRKHAQPQNRSVASRRCLSAMGALVSAAGSLVVRVREQTSSFRGMIVGHSYT